MVHRLIIFTRYPLPGQAKTRLIPALGASGAASLQREMTEHTIAQARRLQWLQEGELDSQLEIEIWFAADTSMALNQGLTPFPLKDLVGARWGRSSAKRGASSILHWEGSHQAQSSSADEQVMRDWLGPEWHYRSQSPGDLGDRMSHACQTAFNEAAAAVVIIGTDCPELHCDRLLSAFTALSTQDVVLGEATDGGYYLIGLRRMIPDLFTGVTWGSSEVLAQTVAIAQDLNVPFAILPALSDVDYPEDLAVWHRVRQSIPRISIILPVLNEAKQIEGMLHSIQTLIQTLVSQSSLETSSQVELIVVDGGSQDDTVSLAQTCGVTVMSSLPGRAAQMNFGARAARGEILLFLHADTALPDDFVNQIEKTLEIETVIAGAFELNIMGESLGLRWVEWGVKWRSRLFQMPYGDQAIFLKSHLFWQLGGFLELPIMEDFELIQRLKQRGRVAIAPAAVRTSARRWQKLGILKTTVINQLMLVGYQLGVPLATLKQLYRR